jgi:hypothetical protein
MFLFLMFLNLKPFLFEYLSTIKYEQKDFENQRIALEYERLKNFILKEELSNSRYVNWTRTKACSYDVITMNHIFNICDHFVNPSQDFDVSKINDGDIIYCDGFSTDLFAEYILPLINKKFILISSQSVRSQPFRNSVKILENPNCIMWFCKNFVINHPKGIPFPVNITIKERALNTLQSLKCEDFDNFYNKRSKIYCNFSKDSYPSKRKAIWNFVVNLPWCEVDDERLSEDQFYIKMNDYKYAICPQGNGIDTIRFWEAVFMGTIPIIEHSELDALYSDLPVIYVDDLTNFSYEEIEEKFKSIEEFAKNYYSRDPVLRKDHFVYWKNLIEKTRNQIYQ